MSVKLEFYTAIAADGKIHLRNQVMIPRKLHVAQLWTRAALLSQEGCSGKVFGEAGGGAPKSDTAPAGNLVKQRRRGCRRALRCGLADRRRGRDRSAHAPATLRRAFEPATAEAANRETVRI